MAGKRDDELARTATALPSATAAAAPSLLLGSMLGRYRLEREIGTGGMGVVHAALDPDLERRVALKVLRAAGGGDAEKRLLREARAMARLVHPNVITVHEVGSANGRDYIAMELVEGHTLAEWLRSERRPEAAIIEAFTAAGRGLAAAHAAGIVHRDFKPHNVLRSKDGRIVVTDFGLAREAQAVTEPMPARTQAGAAGSGPELALEATAEGTGTIGGGGGNGDRAPDSSRSTPLAGLTVTGSLLGTPAYMAPEQWRSGAVTPATDQFGFCVALWEALAGERPFRGATVEQLRDEIARGPAALDASKLPRRLRRVLRRGLDPVPSRRWPSMNALITAMTRAERRPVVIVAAIVVALILAAILFHVLDRAPGAVPPPACPPPALDPDVVWSDTVRQDLATRRPVEARMLETDHVAWRSARERACEATSELGVAPLLARHACLDAVLARFDAITRAVISLGPTVPPTDPGAFLIDPVVCDAPPLPRLAPAASSEVVLAYAAWMRSEVSRVPVPRDDAAALLEKIAKEPCAAALGHLMLADATGAQAERYQQLAEAEQDAERCNDDRVRAEIAIAGARQALTSSTLGAAISAKIRSAEVAAERVSQRDVIAELDKLRIETARRADQLDEAIHRGQASMNGFAARGRIAAQLRVGLELLDFRDLRANASDEEEVPRLYEAWRALAVKELGELHPMVTKIDAEIARRRFVRGDVVEAHRQLEALRIPVPQDRPRRVRGKVVDQRGRAVANATVVSGPVLAGDSVSVSLPMPTNAGAQRIATTNKLGEFELADSAPQGVIIAQLGDLRSRPAAIADEVTLALEPTSRIEGRIDLGGEPASRVIVAVQDLRTPVHLPYELIAPCKPDGTFSVSGAPQAKVRVFAALRNPWTRSFTSSTIDVRGPVVRGVEVALARSKRVVHVLVRSTAGIPVGNAQVYVFPGVRASMNALEMSQDFRSANVRLARQIEGEHAPPAVVGQARPGDMFATMNEVPEGPASACAIGLPPDLSDREIDRKINANLTKIVVSCVPIPPGAGAVVVEVPPWPRLD